SWAFTMEREEVTRPAAGCGSKAGPRSSTRPPWAPTPGSRKIVLGISSRSRPSSSGRVAPVTAPTFESPVSPTCSLPTSSTRRASCSWSWTSSAPGLEVATSTNRPAPAAAAPSTSGSRASLPSSGLAVAASASRPGTAPNGPGVSPNSACAYAEAVTGTSPRLPSAITSSLRSRACSLTRRRARQPCSPRRSKQASWSLTATQAGPAASIASMQCRATAPPVRTARSPAPSAATTAAGHSPARSGSSPGTTRLRRSCTSAASRSAKCALEAAAPAAGLDRLLQGRAGAEARHPAGRDLDALASLRVDALAGAAIGHRELPEAGEVDLAAALQGALDDTKERVDRLACIGLRQAGLAGDLINELLLRHYVLLVMRGYERPERNNVGGRWRPRCRLQSEKSVEFGLSTRHRHLSDEQRNGLHAAAEGHPAGLRAHPLDRPQHADEVARDGQLTHRPAELAVLDQAPAGAHGERA